MKIGPYMNMSDFALCSDRLYKSNPMNLNVLCKVHGYVPHDVKLITCLTHNLIQHFETVPNSKKLQTTTEMWLLKDFKIQIA